ncbi:PKD domain-containing protein [Jatrophihabitans endophyticus]|uniref:PKD domain-containing protein n=1 Tax=Jatrophihabitans endophyticus TaxID=1206085 RepID=UPI001A003871|nr:PKD domain-containing protein [Jatrophihabitans endophyticus]MBE7188090.1 hypothetical protein [Jatrophihabitans endophyticus]
MLKSRRLTRRLGVVIACGALTAGALATGAAAAPQHPRPSAETLSGAAAGPRAAVARAEALGVTGAVKYAVATPVCPQKARPGYSTCFAVRRTVVPKSTAGAHPFVEPAAAASGPAGGYTPADLAGAYGYNPKAKVHQTVGIVDWYNDPTALSDLNKFDKYYGFHTETKSSFRKVNASGQQSHYPKSNKGTSGEITLDVQSVRAVCRGCRIVLVEAKSPSDANLAKAENEAVRLGATEVTNSFGEPEKGSRLSKSVVSAYNHPGVVITASTGDEGWYGWDFVRKGVKSQSSALFPSTDSAVVAVGGTSIGIQNRKRTAEVVWNEDYQSTSTEPRSGATGGGCSTLFAAAPWQKSYANYKGAHCNGGRLAADVSAIADPYTGLDVYQTYGGPQGGWETIGGTSLASPVTAAMWALAGGAKGAAYPGSALYVNAKAHPKSLYDVTALDPQEFATGNSACAGFQPNTCATDIGNPNGFGTGLEDCSLPRNGDTPKKTISRSRECNVAKGLDGPTGLGTPRSLRLFQATTPTLTARGPAHVKKGRKASFHASAKERPGVHFKIEKYVFYWGDGSRTATKSGKASHVYNKTGKHTVTVLVVDSHNQETFRQGHIKVTKS